MVAAKIFKISFISGDFHLCVHSSVFIILFIVISSYICGSLFLQVYFIFSVHLTFFNNIIPYGFIPYSKIFSIL